MLTDDDIESLGTRGCFVRDDFLGASVAERLRVAVHSLAEDGKVQPAQVRRGGDRGLDRRIRGDLTRWIDPSVNPEVRALHDAFSALGAELSEKAYLGLGAFELQLARYPGDGAHYVRHRDAFSGAESRRLTAIWYANRDWREADGGALRLHLDDGARDVAPVLDRLVVFLSERVEHEVLPTHAPRCAVTAWYARSLR